MYFYELLGISLSYTFLIKHISVQLQLNNDKVLKG